MVLKIRTLESWYTDKVKGLDIRTKQRAPRLYTRGGQLFSSAGHIAPLLVSRGPHFSQKGKVKAKKLAFAGRMWPAGRMLPPLALHCAPIYGLQSAIWTQKIRS